MHLARERWGIHKNVKGKDYLEELSVEGKAVLQYVLCCGFGLWDRNCVNKNRSFKRKTWEQALFKGFISVFVLWPHAVKCVVDGRWKAREFWHLCGRKLYRLSVLGVPLCHCVLLLCLEQGRLSHVLGCCVSICAKCVLCGGRACWQFAQPAVAVVRLDFSRSFSKGSWVKVYAPPPPPVALES
jgi:hypothetical protein